MPNSELLLSFEGRIPRSTLWLRCLLPYAAFVAVLELTFQIAPSNPATSNKEVLLALVALGVSILWLPVIVKRLHDRNRSGWFLYLGLIPLVNLWVLIEIWLLPGTVGSNLYGQNPLAEDEGDS